MKIILGSVLLACVRIGGIPTAQRGELSPKLDMKLLRIYIYTHTRIMHIFPFYVSFPNDYKVFHNTERRIIS